MSALDDLATEDKQLVLGLLACIVDEENTYQNRILRITDSSGTRYMVNPKSDHRALPESSLVHSTNITPLLVAAGLAVETAPPTPRVDRKRNLVIPRPSQGFQFTPLAINLYRDRDTIPTSEIQRRIGTELLNDWYARQGDNRTIPIDVSAFCERVGVAQAIVFRNLHMLKSLGYVFAGRHLNGTMDAGYIFLTEPKGIGWANAGSPPIGPDGAPMVNVTVNITLQQVIQEVGSLAISPEDKERIELLFRRFEEESGKEQPSYKPLQDLLDMATKVKELAPLLFKFGADHLDDIARMTTHIPGI